MEDYTCDIRQYLLIFCLVNGPESQRDLFSYRNCVHFKYWFIRNELRLFKLQYRLLSLMPCFHHIQKKDDCRCCPQQEDNMQHAKSETVLHYIYFIFFLFEKLDVILTLHSSNQSPTCAQESATSYRRLYDKCFFYLFFNRPASDQFTFSFTN